MTRLVTQCDYIKWLDSSLEGFISDLRKQVNELVPPESLSSVRLDLDTEYAYEISEGYPRIKVIWERLETDKEEEKRKEQEKKAAEYRKKQYEALKKEFGQ